MVKATKAGTSVASFSVAINRYYVNKANNEKMTETTYVDVETFGQTAENARKFLGKGSKVCVCGRLKQDSWKDQSGMTKSRLLVYAEQVEFLGAPKSQQQGANGYAQGGTGYAPQPQQQYQQYQQPPQQPMPPYQMPPAQYQQNVPPQQQVPPPPADDAGDSPF